VGWNTTFEHPETTHVSLSLKRQVPDLSNKDPFDRATMALTNILYCIYESVNRTILMANIKHELTSRYPRRVALLL